MLKIARFLLVGIAVALISAIVSLGGYDPATGSEITSLSPTTDVKKGIGWEIQSESGPAEMSLAKQLTRSGAKMYGAYWCPHCYEQEQLFGKQAWKKVTYIECAADAVKKPQPKVCERAGVKGFPTWSIGGKLDPGVKKLAKLAKLSGYQGSKEFKYDKLLDR